MSKLNPALDPSTFVGLAARIQNGGDLRELIDHADQLLASIAGGDYSILERQEAATQLMCNDLARNCLLKAMQCDDPAEMARWQNNAKKAFDLIGDSVKRLVSLGKIPQRLVVYTPPDKMQDQQKNFIKEEVRQQLNHRKLTWDNDNLPGIPVWDNDKDPLLIQGN